MTEYTQVVNGNEEDCDVWIDRRSRFGNPFRLAEDGGCWTREGSIRAYRDYLRWRVEHDDEFREAVEDLRGKTLGCHCKPKPCHGDVIVEYLQDEL